jgi:formyl-CoA transferase
VARVQHRAALLAILEPAFAARSNADVLSALKLANVPAAEVRSVANALTAPELAVRGSVVEMAHPLGPIHVVGSPLGMGTATLPPPLLGQHTREVLAEVLGWSDAELEALERDGAIGVRRTPAS